MPQSLKKDLVLHFGRTLLSLMLLPALTLAFCLYATGTCDEQFLASLEQEISNGVAISKEAEAFFRANPPSTACLLPDDGTLDEYLNQFCSRYGEGWQFFLMTRLSAFSLVASAVLILSIVGLGLMAFRGREAQYRSLRISWPLLTYSNACAIVLQGVMLVWLSFWVTAFFFQVYYIKLILLAGGCVAVVVALAVTHLFADVPTTSSRSGELLLETDAPALWERIRTLAARIGTVPPDQIIAGIDSNFFVTEGNISLQGKLIEGRTLYVSLPLLRVLDREQADAVLAHELAHLQGGDTRSSAALGPTLAQFDHYLNHIAASMLTMMAVYLLVLYRTIFEIALMRDSRLREFLADKTAASQVSGHALVAALIKVAAYDSYRNKIEGQLYERSQVHDAQIGIAAFVSDGLHPFARSDEFGSIMQTARVPHPFDSHPTLQERMAQVGTTIADGSFGDIVAAPLSGSWVSDIVTGEQVEARLWAAYEANFAQHHEQSLAYRYLPQDDAELAIVQKYFPDREFDLGSKGVLTVTYSGVHWLDHGFIEWDAVTNIMIEDGLGGDMLAMLLDKGAAGGPGKRKLKLPGGRTERDAVIGALAQYWQRHRVARGIE